MKFSKEIILSCLYPHGAHYDLYRRVSCKSGIPREWKGEGVKYVRVCEYACLVECRFWAPGPKSEKNRQKIDFGLTWKIGKKSPKNRNNGSKIGFWAIFPIFGAIFVPIFRVRPKSIFRRFFPISGWRPEIGILPGTHTRKSGFSGPRFC